MGGGGVVCVWVGGVRGSLQTVLRDQKKTSGFSLFKLTLIFNSILYISNLENNNLSLYPLCPVARAAQGLLL